MRVPLFHLSDLLSELESEVALGEANWNLACSVGCVRSGSPPVRLWPFDPSPPPPPNLAHLISATGASTLVIWDGRAIYRCCGAGSLTHNIQKSACAGLWVGRKLHSIPVRLQTHPNGPRKISKFHYDPVTTKNLSNYQSAEPERYVWGGRNSL